MVKCSTREARAEERAEGDFSGEARPRSLSTWLDTHLVAKRGLAAGAALAAPAAVRLRS